MPPPSLTPLLPHLLRHIHRDTPSLRPVPSFSHASTRAREHARARWLTGVLCGHRQLRASPRRRQRSDHSSSTSSTTSRSTAATARRLRSPPSWMRGEPPRSPPPEAHPNGTDCELAEAAGVGSRERRRQRTMSTTTSTSSATGCTRSQQRALGTAGQRRWRTPTGAGTTSTTLYMPLPFNVYRA